MSTYHRARATPLRGVRIAARTVALALAVAVALGIGVGSSPATTPTSPAASVHPVTAAPVWTMVQARAHWDATTGMVDDWFAQWHTDWQLQAYRTQGDLARSARANAVALTVWATDLPAGHWSPALRPLVRRVAVEARARAAWWRTFAALPTMAAMDRAYPHAPHGPAAVALYRALLP